MVSKHLTWAVNSNSVLGVSIFSRYGYWWNYVKARQFGGQGAKGIMVYSVIMPDSPLTLDYAWQRCVACDC